MKMPEFLDLPTIILAILSATVAGSAVIITSYSSYNSAKKSEKNINERTSEEHKKTRALNDKNAKKIIENLHNNDFSSALTLFNATDPVIKKSVIIDLKNKALETPSQRQKIVDFLSTLNDWVLEKNEYKDILLSSETDWSRWFDYKNKNYLKKDEVVFEKEKQILSVESSNAIFEIISKHIQEPNTDVLQFKNKNLLGLMFIDVDFKYGNVDFSGANFFGAYFRHVKNIDKTSFQYANYYGNALFTNMSLPKEMYIAGDIGTSYHGDLTFLEVEFPYGVNFTMASIGGDLVINSSIFRDDAHFFMTNFKGTAQFHRCRFEKEAMFNSAIFNKKALFGSSEFLGKTQFASVQFSEEASFKNTTFLQEPSFNKTNTDNVKNLTIPE